MTYIHGVPILFKETVWVTDNCNRTLLEALDVSNNEYNTISNRTYTC